MGNKGQLFCIWQENENKLLDYKLIIKFFSFGLTIGGFQTIGQWPSVVLLADTDRWPIKQCMPNIHKHIFHLHAIWVALNVFMDLKI